MSTQGVYGTDISYARAAVSCLPVVGVAVGFVNLRSIWGGSLLLWC